MHFNINLSYTVFIYESVFPAQVLCVWYVFIIFTIYITVYLDHTLGEYCCLTYR